LAILLLAQNELATGKTAEAQKTNGGQQVEHWRWCIDVIIEHRLGRAHESQRILNELIERYGQHSPIFISITYAWRGEADLAFEWLERPIGSAIRRLGSFNSTEFCLDFQAIRATNRFCAK
jgi:hypothetical protein